MPVAYKINMATIEIEQRGTIKIEYVPCIKCGSEDIEFDDCGYSSFNVAWGRCNNCKNEAKISPCGCDIKKESIISNWNQKNDPKILRKKYEKEIAELQKLIELLPK